MHLQNLLSTALLTTMAVASFTGCASSEKKPIAKQPAVQGNSDDAALAGATNAKTSEDNRPLRAMIGDALGAGGGFVCGVCEEKIEKAKEQTKDAAIKSSQRAEKNPAGLEDADKARTADLNGDGFVTLDEIVALRQANLNDGEILSRLARTNQIFELTEYQQDYLRTRGVSDKVIHDMEALNHGEGARVASETDRSPTTQHAVTAAGDPL